MKKYKVIHGRVMTCHTDIQQLLEELGEVDDRHKPVSETMNLIGWLIAFYQPWPGVKFVRIERRNIGASRWLNVKINEIHSPLIQSLFRDLVKLNGGHPEYHDDQKLYVFLNSMMRNCCRSMALNKK